MAEVEADDPCSKELEFQSAKAYLLTRSSKSGGSLYEHLSKVISNVLGERPNDALDVFEDVSREVKRKTFCGEDTLRDKMDISTEVAFSQIQEKLYKNNTVEEEPELSQDDEVETPLPNIMELSYYFEQAGVGMNREEFFKIWLALKQLVDTHPLEHVRFWGKILGTEQNYYVAEVEFRHGEEEEQESEGEAEQQEEEASDGSETEDEGSQHFDEVPKPAWQPSQLTPPEEPKSGANKKTYFVCNDPGKPWRKLPNVTPQQITVARQIKKFFTGRLDAYIVSYPPFPGNESNYLRAQIARISAGTHISPLDFYQFNEDDMSDVDEEQLENFVENLDFEEISVKNLCDPSLGNWVHHEQHILPQGRCVWWNPVGETEEEESDDDEAKEEQMDEPEPEVGPPLLTPLSEDAEIDGMPPWTAKPSTNIIPQYAIAVLKSNLWPGAYAFAHAKNFENLYIGWGHKYSEFSPAAVEPPMQEYESGTEVTEIEDPSTEEEKAVADLKAEEHEAEEMGEHDQDEDD
ncbi:radial spoke head protein 4 homolog A-like [Watersipora subatra]|uniref:radial spoke head protein 4 homolog A-like n=1 Tax=Watersipora subatra TaxID=2589382 RepID=UPI00355AF2C3